MLYGLSLSILLEKIRGEHPGFIESWYDDYFIMVGSDAHLKPDIACIEALGPTHTIFIETDNSQFVQAMGVS